MFSRSRDRRAVVKVFLSLLVTLLSWLVALLYLPLTTPNTRLSGGDLQILIREPTVLRVGEDGVQRSELRATLIRQMKDGTAEIYSPVLEQTRSDSNTLIKSRLATMDQSKNLVDLIGGVEVTHRGDARTTLNVSTERVRYSIRSQTLETAEDVRVTRGGVVVFGKGLRADNTRGTLEFVSSSQMTITPPAKAER